MEIKVLGPGCANCQDLERRVKQALAELKVEQITAWLQAVGK
ncbi:MAG: thioredoxin family protein [Candidatus Margulisiibacteriota bacterium]